jgi:hypothetical protein
MNPCLGFLGTFSSWPAVMLMIHDVEIGFMKLTLNQVNQ